MTYATRLAGGTRVNLDTFDPNERGGLDKKSGKNVFKTRARELGELQELLYAAGTDALLVILQGLDTSGKDGTVRHVFSRVNPQGCQVTSFKVPTDIELAHDFLWRIHEAAPARGMIGVFNRSQYEDVLVARVHRLVPEAVWRKRYDDIVAFERLLSENGTIVAKFFLHISKDEQEERLLAREEDPTKAWKLSAQDWIERESWDDYIAAYEDAISASATPVAPWYIVPANRKWFRNLAIADVIVRLLRPKRAAWMAALHERGQTELAAIRQVRGDKTDGRERDSQRKIAVSHD